VIQNIIILYDYVLFLQQMYYFVLQYMLGIFHHAYAKDALLHTFVIFIAVSKRI
jgi:hypothetical protein